MTDPFTHKMQATVFACRARTYESGSSDQPGPTANLATTPMRVRNLADLFLLRIWTIGLFF